MKAKQMCTFFVGGIEYKTVKWKEIYIDVEGMKARGSGPFNFIFGCLWRRTSRLWPYKILSVSTGVYHPNIKPAIRMLAARFTRAVISL